MFSFAIQKDESPFMESIAIHQTCVLNKWPVITVDKASDVPSDFIPCGTVEWCLQVLGREVEPDYYPVFLLNHLYRKIWKDKEWPSKRVFIKPADKYKRFTGFVVDEGCGKIEAPSFWCSDIVSFKNEWRYYVTNGEVVASGWYAGDEKNMPDPPVLDLFIPTYYCGALDFGTLETGELALVEANHPFACGWYGQDHKAYALWLAHGWKYMKNNT